MTDILLQGPPRARLTTMSALAGRVRWEVRGLRGRADLARSIEELFARKRGVRSVSANPVSGRLLLEYGPRVSRAALERWAEQNIEKLFGAAGPAKPAARTAARALPGAEPKPALVRWGRRAVLGAIARQRGGADRRVDAHLEALIEPHMAAFERAAVGALYANGMGVARVVSIGLAVNALAHGSSLRFAGLVLGAPATLVSMAALAIVATLWRARLRRRSQMRWSAAARDFQHDLRLMVWERVQRLDIAQFDDDQRSITISIMGGDINQCERGLDAAYGLIDLACNTLMFSAAIVAVAPTVGASAVLPIIVLAALALRLHPKVQARFARIGAASSRLDASLGDSLGGLTTVRSFTGERHEYARIEQASHDYRMRSLESLGAAITLPLLLETTILLGQVGTYMLNSQAFAAGQTLGSFSIVNTAIGNLLFPFTTLGPVIDNMEKGLSAAQRIGRFLDQGRFEDDGGAPLDPLSVRGDLRFENITFAYAGKRPVFSGLSLQFKADSWTGVVGLTGSGKSTLVKLLLRFYRPQDGTIALDGGNIDRLSLSGLRRCVSLVSQDVYLFNRSVYDNIAIGRPGAARTHVMAAARAAQAHAFIELLPDGYDTVLGENGHTLSGGERQRIAIARALLKDAPLLVFDEATSSLDSNTEMEIQAALRPLFAGRTVIAIAHRLSSVRHADNIVVLQRGTVVEQGRHDELIDSAGLYHALWQSQLGLEQAEPLPRSV